MVSCVCETGEEVPFSQSIKKKSTWSLLHDKHLLLLNIFFNVDSKMHFGLRYYFKEEFSFLHMVCAPNFSISFLSVPSWPFRAPVGSLQLSEVLTSRWVSLQVERQQGTQDAPVSSAKIRFRLSFTVFFKLLCIYFVFYVYRCFAWI